MFYEGSRLDSAAPPDCVSKILFSHHVATINPPEIYHKKPCNNHPHTNASNGAVNHDVTTPRKKSWKTYRTAAVETGICSTISIPNPCSAGTRGCIGKQPNLVNPQIGQNLSSQPHLPQSPVRPSLTLLPQPLLPVKHHPRRCNPFYPHQIQRSHCADKPAHPAPPQQSYAANFPPTACNRTKSLKTHPPPDNAYSRALLRQSEDFEAGNCFLNE
jgi:hypothetical protein